MKNAFWGGTQVKSFPGFRCTDCSRGDYHLLYPGLHRLSAGIADAMFWSWRISAVPADVSRQRQTQDLGRTGGNLPTPHSCMQYGLCLFDGHRTASLEAKSADNANDGGRGPAFRHGHFLSCRGALEDLSRVSRCRETPRWRCRTYHGSGHALADGGGSF